MSTSPAAAQEQLKLFQQQEDRMQRSAARPGSSQYSAPSHSHDQAINVEREDPQLQQQRRSADPKLALAQAAARMAVDAATLAGQAAEMARQAADMAARAADLPWDGPYQPPVQPAFDMFPRQGSSNFTPIPLQAPLQIDPPMENYQTQFPAAEAPKRKRKSRASAQAASGSSSRPPAALAANPAVQPETMTPAGTMPVMRLNDYQTQLMLLEQANKSRLLNRQQGSGEGMGSSGGAPVVSFNADAVPRPEGYSDYQYQLILLEQHNKKIQEEKNRQQQQRGKGEGSGGA